MKPLGCLLWCACAKHCTCRVWCTWTLVLAESISHHWLWHASIAYHHMFSLSTTKLSAYCCHNTARPLRDWRSRRLVWYWQIQQARFSLTSKLKRNKKYDKRQLTKAIRSCSSGNRIIFDWQRRVSGPATDYTVFISCSSIVVGIDSYALKKEWSRFFLISA